MNYISPEKLKQIQAESNIVEYIGQFVKLRKTGNDYSGLCPFHGEKTPSFHVSADKQVYHCFGCGRSGNIFQFSSQYEHLSFSEAVLKVADYFNIAVDFNLNSSSNIVNEATRNRKILFDLHTKASEFYTHILLHTKQGMEALKYLNNRGITEEDIELFGIGYAPKKQGTDPLVKITAHDNLTEELYEDSGLFVIDKNGNPHDRFDDRIMFSIKDESGQVVAFSGRRLSENKEIPKYINSKETSIFSKSNVLYNLNLAKTSIKENDQVTLFEGYMDVISAYKAGITNGIASMGTSLTEAQINKIRKYTNNILVCYDGDSAGIEASERARIELKKYKNLKVNLMWLPDKNDPDEFIKNNSEESFANFINTAQLTEMQFFMKYLKQNFNLNKDQDKLEYTNLVLNEINNISSPIEQNLYLSELAKDVDLELSLLEKQLKPKAKETLFVESSETISSNDEYEMFDDLAYDTVNVDKQKKELSVVEKAEYMLLYRSFYEKHVRDILKDINFHFPDSICEELYVLLDEYLKWHESFIEEEFYASLQTLEHQELYSDILSLRMSPASTKQEINDYLNVIETSQLQSSLKEKYYDLQEASKMGNKELERKLANEIMLILKEIKNRRKGHA